MTLKRITSKEGEIYFIDSVTGARVNIDEKLKAKQLPAIYPMPSNKLIQIVIGLVTILLTYLLFAMLQFKDIESRDIAFWYYVACSSLLISLLLKYFNSLSLIENSLAIICSFEVMAILRIFFDTREVHNLFPVELTLIFFITAFFGGLVGSFLGNVIKKHKIIKDSKI
jgi:hypothetical protein